MLVFEFVFEFLDQFLRGRIVNSCLYTRRSLFTDARWSIDSKSLNPDIWTAIFQDAPAHLNLTCVRTEGDACLQRYPNGDRIAEFFPKSTRALNR